MNIFIYVIYNFIMMVSGVFWSSLIVSQVYYYDKQKINLYYKELQDETNKKEVNFSDKYKDEIIRIKYNLDNCEDNNNSSEEDNDLDSLDDNSIQQIDKPENDDEYENFFKDQFVNMENENYGVIHMKWDPEDDIYLYYARSREIPYAILDTVCRKFALTYDNCDNYHINFNHDHKQDSENDNGEFEKIDEDNKKKEEEEEEEEDRPKGIFAIFKSSKKKEKLIKKNDKKINHFKYLGNLYDLEDMLNKNKLSNEEPKIMSYKDFKNIKLD